MTGEVQCFKLQTQNAKFGFETTENIKTLKMVLPIHKTKEPNRDNDIKKNLNFKLGSTVWWLIRWSGTATYKVEGSMLL